MRIAGSISRRNLIIACAGLSASISLPSRQSLAGPFDSIELDRRARVLMEGPIVIPPASSTGPGLAGADLTVPQRGFIGIDWVISQKLQVTLMLLTTAQKAQLARGGRPNGEPLMRIPISGPETAGQNTQVDRGSYYVAFLNGSGRPLRFLYRASFLPF